MELTEEEHQRNRDILTELFTEAPTDIISILTCYNHDRNADDIYNLLNKFRKSQLQEAAEFLQHPTKSFKYKDEVIRGVISRIDSLLLESCSKCNIKYSVGKDEIPILSCITWGQGCHSECYKDVVEIIKQYPGIYFQCNRCETKNSRKENTTETQENNRNPDGEFDCFQESQPIQAAQSNKASQNSSQDHDPTQSQQVEDYSQDSNPTQSFQQASQEQSKPTCERYRRGKCPHGITGRYLIDGEPCFFHHPKRCMRFCKNGPYRRDGCDRGRDCDYMHPILCKYSLRYRKCTNLRCRFTHLQGTRRYETNYSQYDREPRRYEEGRYETEETNFSEERTQERNFVHESNEQHYSPPARPSTVENHFLEKLPGILNQIQQDLQQLKQRQTAYPQFPAPNISPHLLPYLSMHSLQPPQKEHCPEKVIPPQETNQKPPPLHLQRIPPQLTAPSMQMNPGDVAATHVRNQMPPLAQQMHNPHQVTSQIPNIYQQLQQQIPNLNAQQ